MPVRSPAGGSAGNVKRPAGEGIGEGEGPHGPNGAGLSPSGWGSTKKQPRLDPGRGAEDFSSVVKNRLQSYTRTGQACDRCKVRKIRCDALPEGCSHCVNLRLECFVTDRVSGRTERRGYMQQLEREKREMMAHIRELEKFVKSKNFDVLPYMPHDQTLLAPGDPTELPSEQSLQEGWEKFGSLMIKDHSNDNAAAPFLIPNFPRSRLEVRPEETWLGVGWDSRPLSSINGTKLTIMGTTIDTASFVAPDMDEPPAESSGSTPLYNKSVQGFLQSAMGVNPPLHADLPPRQEAFTYTHWYFMFMAGYIPVLHKPTFMKLLERVYDEPNFKPSTPELVQVHMVFAIIFYQYGVRNWQEVEQRNHLNETSNKHYHFALSKFYELLSSRDLSAIQAMTLIAAHTRAFPKPGCGLMVADLTFRRAIDLELHRNPKIPESGTNLGIEMQKRTWWVLLAIYVAVTGRRGLPMPITVEEFDTTIPEAINDEQLTETGVDMSDGMPCNWEVGRAAFKMIPIMMEMYSNIYSVRRDTQNYSKVISALEAELDNWENELPESLRLDAQPQSQPPDQQQPNLAALYLKGYCLEIRLSLRHTSTSPVADKKLMAENTRRCEDIARELLRTVTRVYELKSLDTTWTQMSIYTMAAFSMLVSHWERRFDTNPDEVAKLREDMNDWMAVLQELSNLMAAGPGIQEEIGRIMERTIAWIEHDMSRNRPQPPPVMARPVSQAPQQALAQPPQTVPTNQMAPAPAVRLKTEQIPPEIPISQIPQNPAVAAAPVPQPPAALPQQQQPLPQQPPAQHQIPQQQPQPPPPPPQPSAADGAAYHPATMNGHTPYPALAYGEHTHPESNMAPPSYDHEQAMFYNATTQHAAVTAAGVPVNSVAETHSNPLIAFASQATQHVNPNDQLMWQRAGGNAWQDWTAAIADNADDHYRASTLLALGTTPVTGPPGPRGSVASLSDGASHVSQDMSAQWPLVMLDHQNVQPHLQLHQAPHGPPPPQHPHQHHGHPGP